MKLKLKKIIFAISISISLWAMRDPDIRKLVDKVVADNIGDYLKKEGWTNVE